ncbi:MAG: TIGR03663 family protein [Anaerolineae bacterium]|nr:TIGR03663 family protein [Anaerolineae bacterium]
MATTIEKPSSQSLNVETWLARVYTLNWEMVVYTVIAVIAVISRFWDLGVRVMSHDESLHTYYSWRLYDAGDYSHTPLMHGPVLFHAVAFFYFLFGVSDFSARIYAALLGILIVMYPILLRRWLGKLGAVLASVGLLVSPMMLYYSRYIREDIPNLFYLLVMFYAMLQYMDGERPRRPVWMLVFSGSMLLMLASKEVGFMYVLILAVFLMLYWILRLFQEFPLRHRYMDGNLFTEGSREAWQPSVWQMLLGHLMVTGAALILGFFLGYLLDYWHYASLSWTWFIILAGLVLMLRLVVYFWDGLMKALRTNQSRDILMVILAFLAVVGLAISLLALYNRQYAEGELDRLTEQNTSPTDASTVIDPNFEQKRADLTDRIDTNRVLSMVGGVVALLFLAGLVAMQILGGDETERLRSTYWLVSTAGILGAAVGLLTLLRLLTTSTFLDLMDSINDLADRLEDITESSILLEPRHVLIPLSMLLVLLIFQSVGFLRTFFARERRPGLAQMLTEGIARPKSAMMIIMAGTILGGVLALHIYGVLDIIEPDAVWNQVQVQQQVDPVTGLPIENSAVAVEPEIQLNARLGNGLLLWIGLPVVVAVVLVIVVAMLVTPASHPIPWNDILAVLLVMAIVGGVLVYAERHSLETEADASEEPVAVDPNQQGEVTGTQYKVEYIWGAVLLALLATALVILWRYTLPHTWEFLNRQPAFDFLIIIGTMILPWASAFPVFWAGYTLDVTPFPSDTVRASIWVLVAFWMLSASIGVSWNWKLWLMSTAVFLALFLFFFMTVFTNGQGLLTGMVGSLGYWLEQQGVRRGSQPQYYYTLVQIPIYEFMPLILAGLGGVAGLRSLFRWRYESALLEETASALAQTEQLDMDRILREQKPLARSESLPEIEDSEVVAAESDEEDVLPEKQKRDWYTPEVPYWARPYDHDEELTLRNTHHEWLGRFPYLLFVAFWCVMITIGLTLAGEKMPWLTTHITVPMTLVAGWYVGSIVEKIDGAVLRRGGWLLLFILTPVLMISTMEVVLPLFGGEQPFAGKQQAQLEKTYAWLGAFAVMMIIGYFVTRLAAQLGWIQTRRIIFAAFAAILTLIAARAAGLAAFKNYDYPTEYLVYAHSGDAVKDTLARIDYIADQTNQEHNLRVAFDDDSSWPMTWYLRDYNTSFFAGDATSLENNPGVLEGAKVVVVGSRKNTVVERILGDEYYRYDFIRLWWPMQKYFDLDYDRAMNVWGDSGPDSALYREGLWDIWWNRDYQAYAKAECVESRIPQCNTEGDVEACYARSERECQNDNRYDLDNWPVSDRMYVYVDKEIAAQIWDAGVGGTDVVNREPQDALSLVYSEVEPAAAFGQEVGLSNPRGLDVGPDGNIYVADTDNNRITDFSPEGEFLREFGSTDGLNQPWGVEVAPDGTVWVADTWNHQVKAFTPEGQFIIAWGYYGTPNDNPGDTNALYGPRDITVDLNGNILVADTGGKRIRMYTPQGEWLIDVGFSGGGLGQLNEPVGLAVNPVSGDLLVADSWNRRVQTFLETGIALRTFDVPMWYDNQQSPDRPYLDVSPDGTLLAVSDMSADGRNDGPRIVIYDLIGTPLKALNAPDVDFAAGQHGIRVVAGIAFAEDGTLYALDSETGRVVSFPALNIRGSVVPAPREGSLDASEEDTLPLPTEDVTEEATEEVSE